MNKRLAILVAGGALALTCATSSSAAVFTDLNDYTAARIIIGVPSTGSGRIPSFTDELNIAEHGYTPGTPISSAVARFTMQDENRNEAQDESFDIFLGGEYFTSGGSSLPFAVVAFGGNLVADLLIDLEADGRLSFTVTATQGDFRFKSASLAATVPDGGITVGIFGLGLLGIAGFRRIAARKVTKG